MQWEVRRNRGEAFRVSEGRQTDARKGRTAGTAYGVSGLRCGIQPPWKERHHHEGRHPRRQDDGEAHRKFGRTRRGDERPYEAEREQQANLRTARAAARVRSCAASW